MFQILILALILPSQISSSSLTSELPTTISCHDRQEIDSLVLQIIGFGRTSAGERFPETKAQLMEFCDKQYALIALLEAYKSTCTTGKRRQLVALTVYSMKHWNNQICRRDGNSKLGKKLLSSSPCANKAANGYRRCINNFIDQLVSLPKGNRTEEHGREHQLATICCSYHRTFECMHDVATPLPVCSESAIEWNQRYIHLLIDNTVSWICGEYNDVTDKCERMWKANKLENLAKRQRKVVKEVVDDSKEIPLKPFFSVLLDTLTSS